MKKKICLLLLSICVAASFAACGGKKEETPSAEKETEAPQESAAPEETESAQESDSGEKADKSDKAPGRLVNLASEELAKYVSLGNYKGLSVDENVDSVTEGDVDQQIQMDLEENPVEVADENAAVESGDTVNIDYVGKKDGVAFKGGTDEGYDLKIGSGTFIDGFEDGLVGCKKGDTVDLNLTFPEDYQAEDLAGQDVVFTVTVNSIKRPAELSEEWVAQNTDSDSIDAYRADTRKELEASNEETAKMSAMNELWGQIVEDTKVKSIPDSLVKEAVDQYKETMMMYAGENDMDPDEFLSSQGITDEQIEEYSKENLKQTMIVQAIMDAEGMTLDDEGQKEAEKAFAESYGIDDIEAMSEEVGEVGVDQSVAMYRVWNFIMDNAKVNRVISTEDGKQGYDADAEE